MKNYSLNLFRWSFIILCFFTSQLISAQSIITGTVMDGSVNETLIGGTVQVKGKTVGTITDLDGKYSISAAPSDVLVFSYIGLESQEIPVGTKKIINLTLKPSSVQLDEVVAIGYGVVKKSDLTGSVSVVSTKELTKNPAPSAAQALQGKAAGVLVTQSGEPGGKATIRVRGVGSINIGSDPIFILDGVEVSGIDGIQPHDIESMQVLKDASATAIYGANGANGVIIVTTKRGKAGKAQVSLNAYTGITMAPKQYNVMNADEYSAFYSSTKYKGYGIGKTFTDAKNEVVSNPAYAYSPEFRQNYYGAGWQNGTNWQDELFKNGLNQNYNLSIAGGGENSNFNVSFGYTKEDGIIIKNNADRFNIRANSDFKLGKYIKIGENLSAFRSSGEDPTTVQTSIWDLNASPLMKINNDFYKGGFESMQTVYYYKPDGSLGQGIVPVGENSWSNTVGNDKPNPIAAAQLGDKRNYNFGVNASVYFQVDFTDWLMFKSTPSAEISNPRDRSWLPRFTGNRASGDATLTESSELKTILNFENQLLFKKIFNNTHNVQATVVQQARSKHEERMSASVYGFDFEQLNTLTNGGASSKSIIGTIDDYRMLSYLGRVMYDYKSKYYATASYRSDGVSLFAPGLRRGEFYSGSLAWKVNGDFLKDFQDLDMFKLRVGWGQTGNSNIGGGFQYLDNISPADVFAPVFGRDQHIARGQYIFYGMGSPKVTWESSEMINFGTDLSFWSAKLQISAEYYIKNNYDLLMRYATSNIFGRVDGNPWVNSGKIQNSGLELTAQWRDRIGDFSYGITSNLTTIKNEVKFLESGDYTTDNNRIAVGQPIGSLFGYVSEGIIQVSDFTNPTPDAKGVYSGYKYATHSTKTPQPGDIRYSDLNGDGDVNPLDKTVIGKTIPGLTYTLGFDCSYKNFDLNVFLFGVSDFEIFNQQRASLSSMNTQDMDHNKLADFAKNYWTPANASTKYVRADMGNSNSNDQISSFWIEDGSFLRIKDIQLGYRLSDKIAKKIGISNARVYISGSNLYCFTKYKGRDPEPFISGDPTSAGTDGGNYSIPRTFTGGIQIGF